MASIVFITILMYRFCVHYILSYLDPLSPPEILSPELCNVKIGFNITPCKYLRLQLKGILSSVYTITYWLSERLPYGDILHSLTYAGIRWRSLAHRFAFVFSSSQYVGIRWHTLLFAQYVEDFCACTKFFDVCRRMNNTQRVRPSNATRTLCSFTIR